jgi:hypothetical protein
LQNLGAQYALARIPELFQQQLSALLFDPGRTVMRVYQNVGIHEKLIRHSLLRRHGAK